MLCQASATIKLPLQVHVSHTRTNLYSQPAGSNLRLTAHLDEPHETSEPEDYDVVLTDSSSPGHSGKAESRSSSTGLDQYAMTADGSSISLKKYATGSEQLGIITRNHDLNPPSSAYVRLTIPQYKKRDSRADGHYSKKPASSTAIQSAESVLCNRNPTRHHLQPEIWERYKEVIQDVYIDQNKSLHELMQVMHEKGFKATLVY